MNLVRNCKKIMCARDIFDYIESKYSKALVDRYCITQNGLARITNSHLKPTLCINTIKGRMQLTEESVYWGKISYSFDYCELFYSNDYCDMFSFHGKYDNKTPIYVFYGDVKNVGI